MDIVDRSDTQRRPNDINMIDFCTLIRAVRTYIKVILLRGHNAGSERLVVAESSPVLPIGRRLGQVAPETSLFDRLGAK